jgi:NADPH:quinone reductase-like Zn-dependent oxidoreductase
MRALRYARYGPPEVLEIVEVPEPSPAAGEVKVRVRAAGLNPIDWKIRGGARALIPVFLRHRAGRAAISPARSSA